MSYSRQQYCVLRKGYLILLSKPLRLWVILSHRDKTACDYFHRRQRLTQLERNKNGILSSRWREKEHMCFLLAEWNNRHHLYTVCSLVSNCNKEQCKHEQIKSGISIQITCLSISGPDTAFKFVYSISCKCFVSSFLHPSSIPTSLRCFQSCQSEHVIYPGYGRQEY